MGVEKYITLVSGDGFEFVVLREAALRSKVIKSMLDPRSMYLPFSLPLCLVCLFLSHGPLILPHRLHPLSKLSPITSLTHYRRIPGSSHRHLSLPRNKVNKLIIKLHFHHQHTVGEECVMNIILGRLLKGQSSRRVP